MSCEDRVAEALYDWFSRRPLSWIFSFHPPSGKAYSTDLFRIPKMRDGARTRDRHHVDMVVGEGRYLLLVELKCRLSESNPDIVKLREISATYSVADLLKLLRRRLTADADLAGIQEVVLALGCEEYDAEVPEEFVAFWTGTPSPTVLFGNRVPEAVRVLFS